jgi:hypothetical protein
MPDEEKSRLPGKIETWNLNNDIESKKPVEVSETEKNTVQQSPNPKPQKSNIFKVVIVLGVLLVTIVIFNSISNAAKESNAKSEVSTLAIKALASINQYVGASANEAIFCEMRGGSGMFIMVGQHKECIQNYYFIVNNATALRLEAYIKQSSLWDGHTYTDKNASCTLMYRESSYSGQSGYNFPDGNPPNNSMPYYFLLCSVKV